MSLGKVDVIWSVMNTGEVYTPCDLANASGQPIGGVIRILGFLERYGFAERVTRSEPIFRKVPGAPAPGSALRILQMIVNEAGTPKTRRVVSASEPTVSPSDMFRRSAVKL